jgi:uncharacterized protein with HEPN domain
VKRADRDRLDDIADAITAIRAHSRRRADERLKRDAVLYNLMVLGEAVKGLYQIELSVIDDIVARDLTPLAAAVAELRRGGTKA